MADIQFQIGDYVIYETMSKQVKILKVLSEYGERTHTCTDLYDMAQFPTCYNKQTDTIVGPCELLDILYNI